MDRTGIGLLLVCLLCVSKCVLGQDMVNVAPGKTCSQSTTYGTQGPSCNAANRNTGGIFSSNNCIHTLGNTWSNGQQYTDYTPWWEVDLGRTYPVQDIKVWARANFYSRLYPFTITVDGQLCARVDDDGKRERSVRCGSVMYGQVVRLTKSNTTDQNNQVLNLCELEVLVPSGVSQCPAGSYGQGCGQTCSSNCGGGLGKNFCNINSAVCYDGCDDGYWGSFFCQQHCPGNCAESYCQRANGNCNTCKPGFYGNKCDTRCDQNNPGCALCTRQGVCTICKAGYNGLPCTDCAPGYYKSGNLCYQCSVNCKNGRCDSNTGRCDGCKEGRYGRTCDFTCGDGCARCDQDSGNCTACTANTNLKFPGCTECEDGYYRYSPRSSSCTGCKGRCYNNTPCNKTTGHCLECPPGKKGNLCSVACDAGKYGLRCALPCGHCQRGEACDPESGTCPLCHPGYYPPTCQDACRDKTYGQNCSESCGHCKGGQPCNTTTGECTDGCEPGYIDAVCKTQCDAGLHGDRCNEICGHCQVNTTCHHEDGHCLGGCVAEFTGPMCSQATSQENKDDGATNLVGPIVGSIVGVGLVMTISVTAAICWRRKSATSRSSGQDPPTASSISVKDAAPTVSPEPSPLRQSSSNEDNLYSEIRDPDGTYEISEMQSIYDKPSPYSNDDGDREPYMQLTLKTNNVNMPASNAAYVNTKLSV